MQDPCGKITKAGKGWGIASYRPPTLANIGPKFKPWYYLSPLPTKQPDYKQISKKHIGHILSCLVVNSNVKCGLPTELGR
jgi:hypothetical protein